MDKEQAHQEIIFIKKIIEDTQKNFVNNGKIYMLWSLVAIFAIFLKFIKEVVNFEFNNLWIYIPMFIVGAIGNYFLKRISDQGELVKSFSQNIIEGIWGGIGVAIVLLVIVGYITGGVKSWAVAPIVASVFGSLHYMSGIVSGSLWIKYSSFGWWGAAFFMFVFPGEYSVLLLAVLLFFLQLMPGIVLYKRWKNIAKENK